VTSRRRFLRRAGGALGLGLGGGLAGCGYRPGGGDIRWRTSGNFAVFPTRGIDVTDGLVVTVADSTTSFDLDREEWVSGGQITAYSTADGTELWSDHLDADLSCHAVGDGGAAVGFDGTIVRYGADGRWWRFEVAEPLLALGVAGEWVYALTESGALVACSDGVERWWVDLEPELGGADAGFDPVVAASTDAVLCSVAGTVHCVDRSGRRRWARSEVDARRFSFVDGEIFASGGTGLAALDGSTGEPRWITDDPAGTFAVTTDAAYCAFDAELRAYDRSGDLQWAIPDDRRSGRNRPGRDPPDYQGRVAADSEGVYVDSSAGLTAVDPADGRVRWRLSNGTLSAGPYLVESGVLVVDDGELVCHYR
jgi:outer membrane protein assembly factor BamB